MKHLKILAVALGLLFTVNAVQAQQKVGYVNIDALVSLMPGTAKIDSVLAKYRADSLQPAYNSLLTNYQYKDSIYRDSLKTPKAVREQTAKELQSFIYQIQNWGNIENQYLEAKQNELLEPIYRQVYDAVKAVAKEKGYTHVVRQEAMLVAPDGDNLVQAVATRLKIKLPPGATAAK